MAIDPEHVCSRCRETLPQICGRAPISLTLVPRTLLVAQNATRLPSSGQMRVGQREKEGSSSPTHPSPPLRYAHTIATRFSQIRLGQLRHPFHEWQDCKHENDCQCVVKGKLYVSTHHGRRGRIAGTNPWLAVCVVEGLANCFVLRPVSRMD